MSQGDQDARGSERLLAGRYRLLSVVGRGGMGTVWRAHDEALHREVAVKEVLLHEALSDEEREQRHQRTLREARASARLNHPGVVTVHDVVDEGGRPWIVMELVQARSLQEVLDEDGPLPPGRAAAIGRQVAGALRAAHAIGILHRDVKPANVLITGEDRAVLTDFGIAQIAGDATLTRTGLIMGSPAYMSPERVNGDPALPASDLWALGATLYAACEGRPPHYRTDAMAVLAAILTQEPPPPRNAGHLGPVLRALLERDPARRPGADEAEKALARVQAGEPPAPAAETRWEDRPAPAVASGMPTGGTGTLVGDPGSGTADVRWSGGTLHVPAPEPTPWSPPTGPVQRDRPGRKLLWPLVAGALGVAVVALAVVLMINSKGDGKKDEPPVPPVAGSSSKVSPPATRSDRPADDRTRQAKPPAPPLPTGMRWVGDGYKVPVPLGWTKRVESADRVYWEDPASDAYIMVDRTVWTGDPHAHWRQWSDEVVQKGDLPNYNLIRLTRTQHQGLNAADIEFTATSKNLRFRDRGVIIDGQSYAIAVAVPQAQWNQRLSTVNNVLDGFHA
ncbi:serine/threonine-protein kinase [Actinomadura hibisca]|uniref:serine/threonine-protein kinase n=1 Tax=Actinomadura hibisca TaxID=68565 RepID=UPI000A032170|nr:serine/threonine-protein kinase [Actinomadura hibisca]